jgi:hypothetical protein
MNEFEIGVLVFVGGMTVGHFLKFNWWATFTVCWWTVVITLIVRSSSPDCVFWACLILGGYPWLVVTCVYGAHSAVSAVVKTLIKPD